MITINLTLEGTTPLMQHRMPEEELMGLLGKKQEKKKVKEVLTPRQIADKHVYKTNDNKFYIPTEYVVGAFKSVAGDYKQNNSARKSIKTVASGVFRPLAGQAIIYCPTSKKPVDDFEVDIRKGVNHLKGAVCVCRPRFDRWTVSFDVNIDDTILSEEICQEILNDAGKRAGIGSFRVSKGGYFGQFRILKWNKV